MAALTSDEILKYDDANKRERVDVPEWGGYIYVRVMTSDERDQFELRIKSNRVGIRAFLVCMCACDEHGVDLFASQQHLAALSKKSSLAMDRIVDVIIRLNGLDEKSLKEMEKNSGTTQESNSGTG